MLGRSLVVAASLATGLFSTLPADADYFVKNYISVQSEEFFVIRDQATFDSIFGYAATMGKSLPPLNPKVFTTKTLLAVAVKELSLCTLTVSSVRATTTHATLRYTKSCDLPGTATYVTPLLVQVPRSITSATFVEDGNTVGQVSKPSTPIADPTPIPEPTPSPDVTRTP